MVQGDICLVFLKLYLTNMMHNFENLEVAACCAGHLEHAKKKAEQYVLSVIQAQPKESKCTVDDDSMKTLRAEYIKNNTYDLIDPIGVAKVMESLTDEIDAFNVEIDAALSVSNAITTIEFEY